MKAINLLLPKINKEHIPPLLKVSLTGALIAGIYGIIHDLITYSISPEYFTRLKFKQFYYADFGYSQRVLAATIGFLAAWWVGFFSGWFLCRYKQIKNECVSIFGFGKLYLIILSCAFIGSVFGYFIGINQTDYSNWGPFCYELGVNDIKSFVTVAWIHNFGYAGGFIGFLLSIIFIKKQRN